MNIFNVFSASFFAAAKLCVFSFVLVNLPFSVNAQSADLHNHYSNYSSDILEAKKEDAHKKRRRLEQLTLTLAKQIKQNQNKNNKNSIDLNQLNDLIDTAHSRQTLISELLELSPNAVKRSKLPSKISKHAPDEIKQYLLQQQELEGELEIFYEDYEQAELSRLRHVLNTKAGRVELHFENTKALSKLKHGSKVKAKGLFIKNSDTEDAASALIESQTEVALLADDGSTVSTASVSQAQLSNTLGEQKTLVLLVNFQDNPTEQPWTKEEVQDMVFGTVNDYYQEASYGQTWLVGDVMGYYTLPIDATCSLNNIDNTGRQIAMDNGIDVNNYDRWIYVFPSIDCGWTGMGTVGGTPSRAFINGSMTLRTLGHEFGHNLGLRHARDLRCDADVIGDNCISIDYGDTLDIMGKSGVVAHFNSFSKEQLGWFNQNIGEVITADSDGSFHLEPFEVLSDGEAKTLKVLRGYDSITNNKLWYYLEYRQALGFDSFLEGNTSITDGVVFHLATETDIASNQLLDMTPDSQLADFDDAALIYGHSYNDVNAGLTITTEWADRNGVNVSVNYSGQSCIKEVPSLDLLSNESEWVEPGTSVTYTVTVTNNDSTGCEVSNYDISASIPSGWTSNNESVTLAAGDSGLIMLTVTSTLITEDGFYDIAISAQNTNDSSYSSTGVVSYVVETPIAACLKASPLFSLSVDNSDELEPGTMTTYLGTLTNQDSNSCDSTVFDISANVPFGWSAENISVSLASGQTSNVVLNVSSSSTAVDGVYNFIINAKNNYDINYSSNEVATYTVLSQQSTCVREAPQVVISNPQGSEVVAGTSVGYSATITNKDSDSCLGAHFDVFANIPVGWSANSVSVHLQPGSSTDVNLNVSSPVNAVAGTYNIMAHVKNSTESDSNSTAMLNYTVKSVINTAPVAVDDYVNMTVKEAISINVLGNDWDPENDSLSISSVTQGSKGSIKITSGGQLIYTPAKSFKSSDSFSYTISDGDKTSAATVNLNLTSSKGGGGSKGKGKK